VKAEPLTEERHLRARQARTKPHYRQATAADFGNRRMPLTCPKCQSMDARMPIGKQHDFMVCTSMDCGFKRSYHLRRLHHPAAFLRVPAMPGLGEVGLSHVPGDAPGNRVHRRAQPMK
jgi:hypothetical protein